MSHIMLFNCISIVCIIVFADGNDKILNQTKSNSSGDKGNINGMRKMWPKNTKFIGDSLNISNRAVSDSLKQNLSQEEETLYFQQEYNIIHKRVLKFESKLFVPIKRPLNSRLVYADEVQGITSMTIGDHKCDTNYGNDLKVVIIVISSVDGLVRRETIRKTWGQDIKESNVSKLYFAIGLTKDESIQKRVESENAEFGDILQWNFIDNYHNLTIKSLGILRWITLNCFNTKFIYKVDDDYILNHKNLLNFLDTAALNNIYGNLCKNCRPYRNYLHKFFVSESDYPNSSYPEYTGGSWLMSGYIAPLLYETAITKSLPALHIEDVYITGIVATKLGIKREHLKGSIELSPILYHIFDYCLFQNNVNIVIWNGFSDSILENVWKLITNFRIRFLEANTNCDPFSRINYLINYQKIFKYPPFFASSVRL